ncbi:MAG: hypothetical protein BMS9Abin26_0135 [Gammaproteobacteria bacterium]|nr:MAG: hypothetical protein BMS9Abin26_0135 [Gammaproteobacteria bacterium]
MSHYPESTNATSQIGFGFAEGALSGLGLPPAQLISQLRKNGFSWLETVNYTDGELVACIKDHGLRLGAAVTSVQNEDQIRDRWEAAKEAGAEYLRYKLGRSWWPVSQAGGLLDIIIARSDELELPCFLETHRRTATQDLVRTVELIQGHDVELLLDMSHMQVTGDLIFNPEDDLKALLDCILQRTAAAHGRVSNGEQIQLPILGVYKKEIDFALATWVKTMTLWLDRAPPGSEFPFIMELLQDYAIVNSEGKELSDRWKDSVILMTKLKDALGSRGIAFSEVSD